MTTSTTIHFTLESEKKHSVRYKAMEEDTALDTIYVRKSWLGSSDFPETLKVTVEVEQ